MKKKNLLVPVPWDCFVWAVHKDIKGEFWKWAEIHCFKNNPPSMHSCKMCHANFKCFFVKPPLTCWLSLFSFFRAESDLLRKPHGCAMSGYVSPLFPPPGSPGGLALVTGEANLVFGKFSSPEDLSGQSRSVGSVWHLFQSYGKETPRAENRPSIRCLHPTFWCSTKQTKGSKTLRWQVCFCICILESSFSAARIYISFWIVGVCFNDRMKGSQNSRITL